MPSESDDELPLTQHLRELRNCLTKVMVAWFLCAIAAWFFREEIFAFLLDPAISALGAEETRLQAIKPTEIFFTYLKCAALAGFVIALPVIFWEFWSFVAPGLYKTERTAFLPFLLASPFMFFAGAAFAFYVVIPLAFDFFLNFQQIGLTGEVAEDGVETISDAGITFQGSVAEYLSLTITFILAFGLCFQLPVLLSLLGKAGLVSSTGLAAVRKYAVVAILVVAGLVTPPDVFTQVILFVVVFGLYEVSIQIVKRIEKKREARMRAEGTWFEDDDEDEDWDEDAETSPTTKPAASSDEPDEGDEEDDPGMVQGPS